MAESPNDTIMGSMKARPIEACACSSSMTTDSNTSYCYLNPSQNKKNNSHRRGLKRPRQTKQRQHPPARISVSSSSSSSCFLWSSVWAVAILRSAFIITTTSNAVQAQFVAKTLSECKIFMSISDDERDQKLTQAEYVDYINYMSDSYYGDVFFRELPLELTTNFVYWAGNDGLMEVYGALPGSQPTADQEQTLEDICFDTNSILHAITTLAPTQLGTSAAPSMVPDDSPTTLAPIEIPFANCRADMAISDFDADSRLNPEAEYLRFIAHMSIQQLVYDDYQDLPELLRFNFVLLSEMDPLNPDNPRYLNITGSRPGQDLEEIGVAQVQLLQKICHQTQNAINTLTLFGVPSAVRPVGPPPTSLSPTTATIAPVLPPLFLPKRTTRPEPVVSKPPLPFSPTPTSPTPTARPTNSYSQCRLAITSSDRNRNNLISEEEYPELVYRLSGNNPLYRWETYDTLPVNLRDTYNTLAAQGDVVGEINVFGAAPRQNPTFEEREFLELVCSSTEDEIANVPTPAPIMQPTPAPTEDFSECRRDMAFADTSPRDNFLDRPEYVKFVNLLAVGEASFFRYTFYTLPKVLRDNFDELASVEHSNPDANGIGDAIYIYGSFLLQNADPVQVEFLRRICRDTEAALETATMPSATTAPRPTLAPIMIATPAPFTLPPIPATPAPNPRPQPTTPGTPTPRPTLRPLTPRPTNNPTPRPTFFLNFPTGEPTTPFPTTSPIDEGGVNTGALVGGCVAAISVLIACIALGRYALERGKQIQEQQQQQMDDDDKKEDKSDEDEETGGGGVDMFDNIGVAPSPAPSTNEDEESEEEESDEEEEDDEDEDEDEDEEMGGGKEFGEFGGPDLPMDFGEELEIASTSGSDSSGSEEERPSTFDDDEEEEDEEDLDNDAFFGDNKEDGFDAFGGGGDDGWGGDDLDEEESGSGSRSGSGSYSDEEDDEEYSGSEEGSGDGEEDEEGGSQFDDQEESSREESSREEDEDAYSEGEEDEESSREEDEARKTGGADGFGDTFGADGFGDFGASGDFGGGQNDFFGGGGGGGGAKDDGFGGDFFGAADTEGDDGDDSYKSSSQEEEIQKVSNKLDAQIDDGDWEGVAKSIASFASDPEMSESGGDVSDESDSEDESDDDGDDDKSDNPAVIAKRAAYRARVEDLVNRFIPDEKDNIDDMMEQFKGREEDLIGTLTSMEEKSSQQPIPTPPGSDSLSGSHSGSFSASTPSAHDSSPSIEQSPAGGFRAGLGGGPEMEDASFIPSIAEGDEGEEESSSSREQDDRGQGPYGDFDESQSQYSEAMTELSPEDKGEEEGSYVSGEEGSYVSGEEGSQYSGEEGSYVSGEEGSQYSGEEGSYVSGEEGSQYSGEEGSYVSGEEGSQYSGEEGSGSYVSGEEGSQYSGEEGSYVSGEEGSQYSGEEGSYVSGEEGSQYSDEEGSYVSGEEGSQYSGEEGSYVSGEEGSQYSGEEGEDGSYVSGEEGSYYSDEEGSQYSGEEGSYVSGEGSYYSGEEGSQYSGEEGSYYSGSGSYDD